MNDILVTRSSMPPLSEYVDEISSLWDSHWLTNTGEKHRLFEKMLKEKLGVDNLALFVNGHNALECIIEAMGLKGEVITTPFTFASTVHAISRKGLIPVFADIKYDDFTLDPKSIEEKITSRTCAIIPVHVYGNLCDIDAIKEIAEKHGLKVIYDAAHAFGVARNGVSAACFGDASMFSFHATKVFNTVEGGAVSFKDENLYPLINQWKNFGIVNPESVEYIGGNAKMNELCAAMGICNLRHLDDEISKRKKAAERYWERLNNIDGLKIVVPANKAEHNYAYMPVLFDPELFGASRDEVFASLGKEGIGARKYFYPLVNDYSCYRSVYSSLETPVASLVASRVLTLPLYADLSIEDVDRICDVVLSAGRGKTR